MRREGLNSRQHFTGSADPDQVSINIQPGYDLDRDIEGLSSQVGRLKQVLHLHLMACTFNASTGFSKAGLTACQSVPTLI